MSDNDKPKRGRPFKFSDDDIRFIRQSIDNGFSYALMSDTFNTSTNTISRIARGASYSHVDPPKCTNLPKKGVPVGTNRKTTDEEYEEIIERFKSGESLRKIAQDYDISHETVRKYGRDLRGNPMRKIVLGHPALEVISKDDKCHN